MKKLLLALALFSAPLWGQVTTGYHRLGQVVARGSSGTQAVVVPNANVYVTATATGAVATIYSDPLLSVPITSGMVTADSSGNYGYYMPLGYCVNERLSYPGSGLINNVNICSGVAGSISGSGTANTVTKFVTAGTIGNSSVTDDGTAPTRTPNGVNTAVSGNYQEFTAFTGGVTQGQALCVTGTNDVNGRPEVTACSTGGSGAGFAGIAYSSVSAGGTVQVCWTVNCPALFDNTAVQLDEAIVSTTTAGQLHDTGSQTATAGEANFSVLSGNAGAGTTALIGISDATANNPAGGGGKTAPAGSLYATQYKGTGNKFAGTGPGTAGDVLTSNGSGAAPTFQPATGGSGGGYPSTTALVIGSFSGLYDDGDINSVNIGNPTSVSCVTTSTTTCTVTWATAHGLAVKGAVDMHNLSAWPAGPTGAQAAQYGSFQVTTVPSSTQITFTTPTAITYSCAPCTGNVYDASLWGIWQFAAEPNVYGHGTVYGLENTTALIAANFATWTAGITGTPKIYLDQSGQNDFAASRTVAQVVTDHEAIMAAAHTAGYSYIQSMMVPADYGSGSVGFNPAQFNVQIAQNGPSAARLASGAYYDQIIDTASPLNIRYNSSVMPEPQMNKIFADTLNTYWGVQGGGIPNGSPTDATYSVSALGGTGVPMNYLGIQGHKLFYYNPGTWTQWMDWQPGSTGITLYSQANHITLGQYQGSMGPGNTWCNGYEGFNSSNFNAFQRCFFLSSSGSTANKMYFGLIGATAGLAVDGAGNAYLPGLPSQTSLGTDANGKFIAGTGFSNPMTTLGDAIYGGASGVATRLPGPTTSGHLFLYAWTPIGSAIAPTAYDFGANAATWIKATSPIVATQNLNDVTLSCPTCGTGTGGTSVSQNSGAAETNLPITGFMPQVCSDTSASGTAQSCTVSNTFIPQTGNCVVYTTTTTNSGTGLTVNVNSLGIKSVAIPGVSGWTTTLTPSIIPANKPLNMCYDGTNWNVQQTGTSASGSSGALVNLCSVVTLTGATCSSGKIIPNASTTAITMASIPGTYSNLKLVVHAQTTDTAEQAIVMTFNGDSTASNYPYAVLFNNSTTPQAGTGSGINATAALPSSGSGAGSGVTYIADYANSTFYKQFTVDMAIAEAAFTNNHYAAQWLNTAAINSITLTMASAKFWTTASVITLYAEQ